VLKSLNVNCQPREREKQRVSGQGESTSGKECPTPTKENVEPHSTNDKIQKESGPSASSLNPSKFELNTLTSKNQTPGSTESLDHQNLATSKTQKRPNEQNGKLYLSIN